jgi:hypothetical protein
MGRRDCGVKRNGNEDVLNFKFMVPCIINNVF